MLEEVLTLAMTGATTVVAAMATDLWDDTRDRVARLWRRGEEGADAGGAVETLLRIDNASVSGSADADRTRQALVGAWQIRFEELLTERPEVAVEVAALIAAVDKKMSEARRQWVQNVVATHGGHAYGAQHGDVHVHHHGPGEARPAGS
ncbi:hypothetical protein [Streptosporangium sp. LJ11]|uniref:hypothetical protein n=1 Tax=Streptosporangium sp. LJ11 TaxID=3436927 RepID=UPI003F7A34F5